MIALKQNLSPMNITFAQSSSDFAHNPPMQELHDPIGGAWLARQHGLDLVMPLAVVSQIAGGGPPTTAGRRPPRASSRPCARSDAARASDLPSEARDPPLRTAVARLRSLRCRRRSRPGWPTSRRAVRPARRLPVRVLLRTATARPRRLGGGYHDAISADGLVVATPGRAELNKRWRIRDNMPGTRAFCPMIVRAQAGAAALDLDVRALIHDLEVQFGAELLLRSAVWMTLPKPRQLRDRRGSEQDRPHPTVRGRAGPADGARRPSRRWTTPRWPSCSARSWASARPSSASVAAVTRLRRRGGALPGGRPLRRAAAGGSGGHAGRLQTFLDRTAASRRLCAARWRPSASSTSTRWPTATAARIASSSRLLRRDGVVQDPMILPVSSLSRATPPSAARTTASSTSSPGR